MKLGLVFAALLTVACAKTVTPAKAPKPAPATADDCNKVYETLLAISVRDHLDPYNQYTKEERAAALLLMDQHYQDTGMTTRFFASCMKTANTDQTSCMAKAQDIDTVANCAKLFATK